MPSMPLVAPTPSVGASQCITGRLFAREEAVVAVAGEARMESELSLPDLARILRARIGEAHPNVLPVRLRPTAGAFLGITLRVIILPGKDADRICVSRALRRLAVSGDLTGEGGTSG